MTVAELDKDLWTDNVEAFGRFMPEIAKILSRHVPETRLIDNPDGSHDIEFRGQRLYDVAGDGTTGPDLARKAIEQLRGTSRGRLLINPLDRRSLDDTSLLYTSGLLQQGVDDSVSFLEAPAEEGAYHLVIMGFGLGYHLTELLEYCQPFSICIVEPNIDFLFHSLATFEWRPILERCATWRQSVSIVRAPQAEEISRLVRVHCRNANPAAIDGTLIAPSYANDSMDAATRLFRRDAHLVHTGLGFLVDEMEMVRASYFNLVRAKDYRIFKRNAERMELPAFVVGSGPSIDDDLDFIKEHQDRAIIYCCGSALGVLLANGIRPDFQIILENAEPPFKMLESINKNYSFEGIRLFGSNTIAPQIRGLFAEGAYFIRQSLSSYAMFTPGFEYSLDRGGPTVTNTGLEAAMESGFRDIYLFGCDLGARSPERHHSRFSPYRMAERKADYDAAVVFAQSLPEKALGNFGGLAFTNDIMTWSRDAMEASIASHAGNCRVYNCSDGIKIRGAIPLVSSAIKLKAGPEVKKAALERIWNHFPEAAAFDFEKRWQSGDWREKVRTYAGQLREICAQRPQRTQELLRRLVPLLVPDHDRWPFFEEYFVRGTFMVTTISADYYSRRAHPAEKRDAFRQAAFDKMIELLELIVAQTEWYFDHIDELRTNADLKEGLGQWTEKWIAAKKN